MLINIINYINKYLLLGLIICITLFGKNFVNFKLFNLPGFISDQIILFIILLNIKKLYKSVNNKYLILFITYSLIIILRNINFDSDFNIDNIGQDLLFFIYPLAIFFISTFFDFNINNRNIEKFSIIILSFYIVDYVFERIYIIESIAFMKIDLDNIIYFNLSNLKNTEIAWFTLLIFLYFAFKQKPKNNFLLILIGLNFGFISTQGRTSLYVFMLSLIFLYFFKTKSLYSFKNIKYLFLGFAVSFLFVFSATENKAEIYIEYFNSNKIENNLGINKIRFHSLECFSEQLQRNYEKSGCEIIINNISDEYLYEIVNSDFLEEFKNYENDKIEIKENFKKKQENNCEDSSLKWRVNLLNAGTKKLLEHSQNLLFGVSIGTVIPKQLIESKYLDPLCYIESVIKNPPLRNLHSTFFTIVYRMGSVFLFLYFLFIFKLFIVKIDVFNMIIIFTFSILTSLDPLLDGPIAAIPFWTFLIFINRKIKK